MSSFVSGAIQSHIVTVTVIEAQKCKQVAQLWQLRGFFIALRSLEDE